jgi:hypothetical protein
MKIAVLLITLFIIGAGITNVAAQNVIVESLSEELDSSKNANDNKVILLIYTKTQWSGKIQDGDYATYKIEGTGNDRLEIACGETNVISTTINPKSGSNMKVYLIKNGDILESKVISTPGTKFESSIDCNSTDYIENQDSEDVIERNYFVVGIGMIISIIIIIVILKKQPVLGPRRFRV